MIAQRVGVAAMRRGAAKPNVFFNQTIPRMVLASAMSSTSSRPISTTKISNEEGQQILVNQRLQRPISPHLGIYKIEQTWFGASAWTRITGITLSGTAYLYFASYLISPSWASTSSVKFALAFPFTFHFINGIKHLVYDFGVGFAKTTIMKGEIALWVSSVLGGLYLAFGL
ncbi:Succinate dehydrogenase cytochrome B subunit [Cladobotryum mycophilum]|uniref:Succinate dehydrogenase cytochrome B subunit n=1 Tax=Cladobotryum mycophilum TaxID=491253 RepID=A0ABR0SP01_9HYPO